MPVLGCGAEMAKLMDVSDLDVATIEDVIEERLALGVSQAVAQRQAVDEALAQLAEERSAVMKAVMEQLGFDPEVKPVFSNKSAPDWVDQKIWDLHEKSREASYLVSHQDEAPLGPDGNPPTTGELKRRSTVAAQKLIRAVREKGLSEEDGLKLMRQMNTESRRREDEDAGGGLQDGPAIPFSNKQQPYFSALSRAIDGFPDKPYSAATWRNEIKGLVGKGAIKADELEWTGLDDWLGLQQGKVSKTEIADYLKANGVQVQEVVLGSRERASTDTEGESRYRSQMENADDETFYEEVSNVLGEEYVDGEPRGDLIDALVLAMRNAPGNMASITHSNSKYAQYTLPGGENYREVLLTLPIKQADVAAEVRAWRDKMREKYGTVDWRRYATDAEIEKSNEVAKVSRDANQSLYKSSHWDQLNVLAHIRLNDRTDADGKRVLFVEELQSDWGQEGKKEGFFDKAKLKGFKFNPKTEEIVPAADAEAHLWEYDGKEVNMPGGGNRAQAEAAVRKQWYVMPNAPFVTKTEGWLNLALKRVIKMAVDEGYDKVAFVNGEQSAERYDLSKQVKSLTVRKLTTGLFNIEAQTAEDVDTDIASGISENEVEGYVGKELAQKVISQEANGKPVVYKGVDLKVGGEGMKDFYDSIVPKRVADLMKKLKLDGKLEAVDIALPSNVSERDQGAFRIEQDIDTPFDGNVTLRRRMPNGEMVTIGVMSRDEAYAYTEDPKNHTGQTITQPGFAITDKMREVAADGLPLFANKQTRPANLPDESRWEAFRRTMQDKLIHVEKIQNVLTQRGGTVGEQQNVYRAEERMHGRAQEKLIDFGRNLLEPMLQKAAKYGIELNELAAYAYAKHAQERNAHIDTLNPKMNGAGSGMDDATAQNIMQMVQLSGDQAKFDELHNDLMRLTEATRQEYLKSGLISQDDYDDWTSTYSNYVPLKGFENVDEEGKPRPGAGSGLSVKGKETLRALGRRSRAADIIENIVAEHERAVIRGERNIVAKTFLNLVQANPDPDLWEIQPRKLQRSFDKNRNLVVYTQALDTADSIGAKVAGQQIYIKVKDPLLLRALTNAGIDKKGAMHGAVVEALGIYTNLLRNTLTRYNPVFGAVNAVRDAPMGAIATYDKLGAKGAALYAKYYRQAIMAAGRQEWGSPNMAKEMDRWLKEMRLAGGTTSGVFMRDISEIRSDLRTIMVLNGATPVTLREKMLAKSKPVVKTAQTVGKILEWAGATSEDAARLAAYRAAREMGKTPAEAASIAKNLTTNFNRSGEWGGSINGLYLFFNAGVQGTTRLAQMLTNPKVAKVLAAGTAAAMALALANVSIGGDDDDDVPYWDRIPGYEKERNLIIMLPPGMEMLGAEEVGKKGRYLKIPVQYGLNIFSTLGYQLADLARNVQDPARGVTPGKAAINMVSVAFGSVNPFGGSLDPTDPMQVGMALLPTVGDTVLQQMAGVNAFGRPVGPTRSPYDQKPDSETYSATQAGTASQRLAGWLNSVTGGNAGRSGAIDIMPGTIDNALRNTTGGLGVFLWDTLVNLPLKVFNAPETIGPRDVPYWRNFYGDLGTANDVSRFYDNRARALAEGANAKREEELGLVREYTPEEKALQILAEESVGYTKALTDIRKEEIEIALDPEKSRGEKELARKRLNVERASIVKQYNSAFTKDMEDVARTK